MTYITSEYITGDINQDNNINVADIVKMVSYIIDPTGNHLSAIQQIIADVNHDGDINIIDIIQLVNSILNPP